MTITTDGDYTYDPNGQFDSLDSGDEGIDTFTYTITDGKGGSDLATVTILMPGVNDAPFDDLVEAFYPAFLLRWLRSLGVRRGQLPRWLGEAVVVLSLCLLAPAVAYAGTGVLWTTDKFEIATDIYPAGEAPIPGVTGQGLAEGIREHGHRDVVDLLRRDP